MLHYPFIETECLTTSSSEQRYAAISPEKYHEINGHTPPSGWTSMGSPTQVSFHLLQVRYLRSLYKISTHGTPAAIHSERVNAINGRKWAMPSGIFFLSMVSLTNIIVRPHMNQRTSASASETRW